MSCKKIKKNFFFVVVVVIDDIFSNEIVVKFCRNAQRTHFISSVYEAMRSCTNVIRFLIVLIFPTISSPVQLGKIVNATFSIDSFVSFSTLANRSCEQCLCQMLTNPRLISAVSCEINRSMCYFLFSNSTALIQPNETSSIYMINTNWTRQNSSSETFHLFVFDSDQFVV